VCVAIVICKTLAQGCLQEAPALVIVEIWQLVWWFVCWTSQLLMLLCAWHGNLNSTRNVSHVYYIKLVVGCTAVFLACLEMTSICKFYIKHDLLLVKHH